MFSISIFSCHRGRVELPFRLLRSLVVLIPEVGLDDLPSVSGFSAVFANDGV